nr:hypothetical protein [Tanacetum cinerariifolium]
MAFYLRLTEDVLLWSSNANTAFDLRPTEDVLLWPGNMSMAFDLRLTKDELPWPGNANTAFDLRLTEDVLPWPGNANMTMEYIGPEAMEVVMKKERMSTALRAEACRMCHAGRASRKDRGYQKSMSERAEYRGRTGPMTADTKKENMTGHAKRHGRTVDTKKENIASRKDRGYQKSMSGRAEYRGRRGPMTADTKKEKMTGHAERHGRTADTKKVCLDVQSIVEGRDL